MKKCQFCFKKGKLLVNLKNYQVYQCPFCALLWVRPPILKKLILEPESKSKLIYLNNRSKYIQRHQKQVDVMLNFLPKPQKILEVGSGFGFMLEALKKKGLIAEGAELSREAVNYSQKQNLKVRLGTLNNYYPANSFDIIIALNLIEHLPNPREFLNQAQKTLKNQGLLVIEVPIQESFFHFMAKALFFLSAKKLVLFNLAPSSHIFKFSKKTFSQISQQFNFKTIYQKNITSPFFELWAKTGASGLYSFRGIQEFPFLSPKQIGVLLAWPTNLVWPNRLFLIMKKTKAKKHKHRE